MTSASSAYSASGDGGERTRAAARPLSRAGPLRNLALAHLENEREMDAAAVYRELIELLPKEPLGHANLAVTGRYLEHIAPHDLVDAIRQREWSLD